MHALYRTVRLVIRELAEPIYSTTVEEEKRCSGQGKKTVEI